MFAVKARSKTVLYFSLALVLLLAPACTPEQAPPAGIPKSLWDQGTPDPLKPEGFAPGQKTPDPAPLVDSYRQDEDHIRDWRLLSIDDSGTHLVIRYSWGGGCDGDRGVLVAQTDSAVAIVPIYRPSTTAIPCPAFLPLHDGAITLDKPLGDRKLLHLPGDGLLPPQK